MLLQAFVVRFWLFRLGRNHTHGYIGKALVRYGRHHDSKEHKRMRADHRKIRRQGRNKAVVKVGRAGALWGTVVERGKDV